MSAWVVRLHPGCRPRCRRAATTRPRLLCDLIAWSKSTQCGGAGSVRCVNTRAAPGLVRNCGRSNSWPRLPKMRAQQSCLVRVRLVDTGRRSGQDSRRKGCCGLPFDLWSARMALLRTCMSPGCTTFTLGDFCINHDARAAEQLPPFGRGRPFVGERERRLAAGAARAAAKPSALPNSRSQHCVQ
jgi:hypothetical protein